MRDFYHRFTVDEHSFLAIESLHRLKQSQSEWDKRYAELLGELENPELLYLTLLFTTPAKEWRASNHVEASLEVANHAMDRLDVDPRERAEVLFLISNHLELSAALRRDIFDPAHRRCICRKDGHARTAEDVVPAHLCGHQSREPGSPHALESRKRLAALHRGRELSEPQRRPAGPHRRQ